MDYYLVQCTIHCIIHYISHLGVQLIDQYGWQLIIH